MNLARGRQQRVDVLAGVFSKNAVSPDSPKLEPRCQIPTKPNAL